MDRRRLTGWVGLCFLRRLRRPYPSLSLSRRAFLYFSFLYMCGQICPQFGTDLTRGPVRIVLTILGSVVRFDRPYNGVAGHPSAWAIYLHQFGGLKIINCTSHRLFGEL